MSEKYCRIDNAGYIIQRCHKVGDKWEYTWFYSKLEVSNLEASNMGLNFLKAPSSVKNFNSYARGAHQRMP